MAKKSGNVFGSFQDTKPFLPGKVKPITTEFSKGSVPDSLYAANRESAWTRWRRGYELATASVHDRSYFYNFKYTVPFPDGFLPAGTSYPEINGAFVGFPTSSKEFKVHWAGKKKEGSVRFDQINVYSFLQSSYWLDAQFTEYENIGQWLDEESVSQSVDLFIESVTEDDDYWYVKLNGNWNANNKLPPPLYVDLGPTLEGLKALNGEVLEDRIIYKDGDIIDRETINPLEQRRFGYVQAVLVDTDEETGILKLKKEGSVEATPDKVLVTPATKPPSIGRYLITGPRYCCTCQDFNRRDYSYMLELGKSNKRAFPRTGISHVKPGRYEILKSLGLADNATMTDAEIDRILEIVAPGESFEVSDTVTTERSVDVGATRDNPGVYREFGSLYLRSSSNPGLSGSKAEGLPSYADYSAQNNVITSFTDIWSPVLDELRYCKHVYALRFQDGIFPPEPSDFPVDISSMTRWEQNLVEKTEKEQIKANRSLAEKTLSYMDVPPYNCQSQIMQPMLQRLFNVPLTYIKISGFTMYDKNNVPYVPALGEKPGI
jgi:hypothetical protein